MNDGRSDIDWRLGIDLGGTKIEIIALDEAGNTLHRARVATPQGDYPAIIATVGDLVESTEQTLGGKGSVGIGTPGALSPVSGLLRNSNSVCMNGKAFKKDVEDRLGREIRMANDANCFALSEAVDGAGQGAEVVFGVIVGTGVGGGVIVKQQALGGPNAIAGEWGHNPLPWPIDEERPGPDCYCGKQGCIETWLAGPSIAKDHERQFQVSLKAPEIVERAEQGDSNCEMTLQRYEDRLARALATVINVLDPQVIVLGGGMSNVSRLYDNVPKRWGSYVFSDVVATQLKPPVHGDSSGVRGAAWLWGK